LGFEAVKEEERSVSHIQERERSLSSLSRFAAVTGLPDTTLVLNEVHKHETDWSYFAADPARQITHLSCLPRSRWHDEYMFLRTIHATECCYSGILASLSALPGFIRNRDFLNGTEILKGALFFSDFLSKLFAIFDTMPVPHFFDGFRTATGDASAIQSVRFQTIEVLTRGLGSPKREALTHQHEAHFASNWQPPNDATLVGMCEIARQQQSEGSDFIEIAEILDRDLYKWRARHFGIARKYLPPNVIGTGNEGTPYLAANYRDPRSATGMKDVQDSNNRHLNDEPARVTLSFGLRPDGSPPVAAIRGTDIHAATIQEAVNVRKSALQSLMKSREGFINSTLSHYAGFFGTHPYPVEHQVAAFRKKPTLPGPVVPALLLSIELGTGGLIGLHNTSRMFGQIVFDTASEGENFQGIRGKLIRCDAGELIVRDDRGVIASIYQGPDKRTSASFELDQEDVSWTLLVFGYPSMARADFDILMADAKEFVSLLGGQNVQVWSSYEH
jgi:tryptophan 2,3-dioxygenase